MASRKSSKIVGETSVPRSSRRQGRSRVRPFVAATFAMTADGKITTRTNAPVDFTSREDRAHLLRQRALADAVVIGHATLKADNVRLGLPQGELREMRLQRGQTQAPIRVLVSNNGRIDSSLKIFQSDISPILIFSTTRMPRAFQKKLRERATLHLSESPSVDLAWMLQQLRTEYKVQSIALEGGATLFRSFLERDLVDQLNLTIAPLLVGGRNAPTLTGTTKEFLPASIRCKLIEVRTVGEECFLTYRILRSRAKRQRA
ncbi:MAG: RibD family protein [Chthoniobacterales bacterium]